MDIVPTKGCPCVFGGLLLFSTTIVLSRIFSQPSFKSCFCKKLKYEDKPCAKKDIVVSEITIYPIKSCKGIKVSYAKVSKRGFEYDRWFMLVNEDGKFMSQRKYPRMALITTDIDYTNNELIVSAPGMSEILRISLYQPEEGSIKEMKVDVWGDQCIGVKIGGDEVSLWFNTFLETTGLSLVRMLDDNVRKTDAAFAPNGQTGFADGFPFLIASEESLAALNEKLPEAITMDRFRPNIVVKNCCAFAEDCWKTIRFQSDIPLTANVVKPCSRCTIPNINPETAIPNEDQQPTKALKGFRTGKDLELPNKKWSGQVFFGQNLDHEGSEGSIVEVGNVVDILN